ncbi:hypothetical protein CIB84_000287, partial [Bambusicola thoracicus]
SSIVLSQEDLKEICEFLLTQFLSNSSGGKLPAKTKTGFYVKDNLTTEDSFKTKKHFKKIMFSDLQTLGLKKSMEVQTSKRKVRRWGIMKIYFCDGEHNGLRSQQIPLLDSKQKNSVRYRGTVTEFKSPSEFYIQMNSLEVLEQISKLSVRLQDCYANAVIEEQYVAIRGEVCVARNSVDQAIKCSFANYDPEQQGCNEGTAIVSSKLMGKTCSVIVVDVLQEETMSSFAVDFVLPDCHLAELQGHLCEYCNKLPSNPNFRPVSGELCCAQFTEDDVWYRAAVTAHASENNIVVGYIDYGNFEVLQPDRLRPMIPKLMDLPAQAIRCTLAGIKPLLGAWTSEAISLMKQLVKDKVFTVKVVDKESYRCVVELTDASVIPEINISRCLIEKGCAAEASRMTLQATETGDVRQANEDTANKKKCKWNKFSRKGAVDVIVCTLYSPGEFYCQIANSNELCALNSLNKSLFEYCQKTPPNVFKPKKGDPCCALFSDDGNWYRALVENIISDRVVQVRFVDYGNVEEVPVDNTRQISSSFLELPFQGIKCWLSGIKPAGSKWNPEATKRFHKCASGLRLQARITSFSRDGAGVELIDNSMGHPKVINEMLIAEKLAVKEELQDKNTSPKTSVGHWESIELAVDQTISVCVTAVTSPDLFYVVPAYCKDGDKLLKQLTELQDYCKSCKKQPFTPKLGEACCARFSGDGRWYRAVVLKVSQSTVEVLYADCGNIETVPLSHVLPITDSFLKIPFQTITCSLAGIKKVEWSPLVLDTLKEMLLNKYVTITVKGINGNIKLVEVEKESENGSLNVMDKLVIEGLVRYCEAANSDVAHQGSRSETKCCCAELKTQVGR